MSLSFCHDRLFFCQPRLPTLTIKRRRGRKWSAGCGAAASECFQRAPLCDGVFSRKEEEPFVNFTRLACLLNPAKYWCLNTEGDSSAADEPAVNWGHNSKRAFEGSPLSNPLTILPAEAPKACQINNQFHKVVTVRSQFVCFFCLLSVQVQHLPEKLHPLDEQ